MPVSWHRHQASTRATRYSPTSEEWRAMRRSTSSRRFLAASSNPILKRCKRLPWLIPVAGELQRVEAVALEGLRGAVVELQDLGHARGVAHGGGGEEVELGVVGEQGRHAVGLLAVGRAQDDRDPLLVPGRGEGRLLGQELLQARQIAALDGQEGVVGVRHRGGELSAGPRSPPRERAGLEKPGCRLDCTSSYSTVRPTPMLLRIAPLAAEPLFEQIAFQVKAAVARGELEASDRIPSVRELAKDLAINPNTVARAYDLLENQGVIVRRQGSGCFVTGETSGLELSARKKKLDQRIQHAITEAHPLGFDGDRRPG